MAKITQKTHAQLVAEMDKVHNQMLRLESQKRYNVEKMKLLREKANNIGIKLEERLR